MESKNCFTPDLVGEFMASYAVFEVGLYAVFEVGLYAVWDKWL